MNIPNMKELDSKVIELLTNSGDFEYISSKIENFYIKFVFKDKKNSKNYNFNFSYINIAGRIHIESESPVLIRTFFNITLSPAFIQQVDLIKKEFETIANKWKFLSEFKLNASQDVFLKGKQYTNTQYMKETHLGKLVYNTDIYNLDVKKNIILGVPYINLNNGIIESYYNVYFKIEKKTFKFNTDPKYATNDKPTPFSFLSDLEYGKRELDKLCRNFLVKELNKVYNDDAYSLYRLSQEELIDMSSVLEMVSY